MPALITSSSVDRSQDTKIREKRSKKFSKRCRNDPRSDLQGRRSPRRPCRTAKTATGAVTLQFVFHVAYRLSRYRFTQRGDEHGDRRSAARNGDCPGDSILSMGPSGTLVWIFREIR